MANIKILVGSTYGNTTQLAESCAEKLNAAGHQATVFEQPQYDDVVATDTEILLICTATIGQGEIPDNLLPLYCELRDKLPPMPEVRYGVIALGDSSYETFAEGGKQMEELMFEVQAKRVQQTLIIDSCETMDPEGEAEGWLQQFATAV